MITNEASQTAYQVCRKSQWLSGEPSVFSSIIDSSGSWGVAVGGERRKEGEISYLLCRPKVKVLHLLDIISNSKLLLVLKGFQLCTFYVHMDTICGIPHKTPIFKIG